LLRDHTRQLIAEYEEMYPDLVGNDFARHDFPKIPDDMMKMPVHARLKYLKPLLQQDWTHLFPDCDSARKYYVYAHVNPAGKIINFPKEGGGLQMSIPFYVGKGCSNRAYDLSRNQGHGIKLRELLTEGFPPVQIVRLIKTQLTEAEAFSLESQLVYFFRTVYEEKKFGCLYNLEACKRPNFKGQIEFKDGKKFRDRKQAANG